MHCHDYFYVEELPSQQGTINVSATKQFNSSPSLCMQRGIYQSHPQTPLIIIIVHHRQESFLPEAAPADIMLTQILHIRRLRDQFRNLLLHA